MWPCRPCCSSIVRSSNSPSQRWRTLIEPLQRQLATTRALHEEDLAEGYGEVYLPYAFDQKDPGAATSWAWQYVFPASQRSLDPRAGKERRHHLSESVLQKAVKQAI